MKRILTVALYYTSPTLIACRIKYRRVNIGVTQCSCFPAHGLASLSYQLFIPGTANANRSRQGSCTVVVKAVDTFIGKVDRYTHPGLFNKPVLYRIYS